LEGELGPYIPSSPVKDLSAGLIVDEARPVVVVNSAWNGSCLTSHSGQPSDSVAPGLRGKSILEARSPPTGGGTRFPFLELQRR